MCAHTTGYVGKDKSSDDEQHGGTLHEGIQFVIYTVFVFSVFVTDYMVLITHF